MENKELFELADQLKAAKDRKKELDALTKENNAEIERLDLALSEGMAEAECDCFSRNGHTFYLGSRLFASPASGRKEDMMQALKDNGYGSLVVETVNAGKIDAFPLKPSMIIRTRKSLHTYWFIKYGEVPRFRGIQKGLVKHFDGDPMCVNESRVMRLPGYNHSKKDPVMVECIYFHPEIKYTQDELADVLPKVEDETPLEAKRGSENGLTIVHKDCDFIKYCEENAKNPCITA